MLLSERKIYNPETVNSLYDPAKQARIYTLLGSLEAIDAVQEASEVVTPSMLPIDAFTPKSAAGPQEYKGNLSALSKEAYLAASDNRGVLV